MEKKEKSIIKKFGQLKRFELSDTFTKISDLNSLFRAMACSDIIRKGQVMQFLKLLNPLTPQTLSQQSAASSSKMLPITLKMDITDVHKTGEESKNVFRHIFTQFAM